MELSFKTDKSELQLTTYGDKTIDFKTVTKVYEIVTGDEIEINEVNNDKGTSVQESSHYNDHQRMDERTPSWHEPVQVKLMCPYCGTNKRLTTLYGNHFIKCPKCGNKVHLQSATSHFGVPDEHGNYYKAVEVHRDFEQEKADNDMLLEMKQKMESNNTDGDDMNE